MAEERENKNLTKNKYLQDLPRAARTCLSLPRHALSEGGVRFKVRATKQAHLVFEPVAVGVAMQINSTPLRTAPLKRCGKRE